MSQSLHELVHEAARVHGDKIAAVFDTGDAARTCLTYEELIAFVNELLEKLRISVGQDERAVGVFCHADIFLPVWIISVLQLPAAYVPLDPVSPPLLTLRIMDRCNLRFCLIQSSLLQQFQSVFSGLLSMEVCATWSTHNLALIKMQRKLISSEGNDGTQTVDDHISQNKQEAKQHLSAAVPTGTHQGEQLAYVLHTSGTTGLPKIVKVPHNCIVPNIIHLRSLFKMTAEDVVFLASPLTFDPSVVEMFLALTSGACLLMVPSAVKRMPGRLARLLFKQNSITVLQATPTLIRRFGVQILQEEVLSAGSSLRVLALGGEAFPSLALLGSWRQEGNKTCIYNLYGTTEVSCWACCYELPNSHHPSDNMSDASVPLGEPLMDTAVEVRDDEGHLVTEGEGQVFIGGQERVCLLDDERSTAKGTMRATGDWVLVRDSDLYYLGRKDRLIKRHGQRVHLDALQQAAESLPQVDACVMGLHEGSRLVAFIVPTTYSKAMYSSERGDLQEQHGSSSTGGPADVSKEGSFSSQTLEKEVLRGLSQLLPSHGIPDAVLLVHALPLTNHGKVAMDKLMRMYEKQREVCGNHTTWGDTETVRKRLQALWKECLGLADDAAVAEDAHFMLSGGDSLQALRLFDYITVAMGTTSPGLLEVLLDGSFSDVLKHLTTTTRCNITHSAKRPHEDSGSVVPSKRYHIDEASSVISENVIAPVVSSVMGTVGFVVVRRAGQVLEWDYSQSREEGKQTETGCIKNRTINERTESGSSSVSKASEADQTNSSVRGKDLDPPKQADIFHVNRDGPPGEEHNQHTDQGSGDTSQSGTIIDGQPLSLQVLWSSDTGRCVDASPVLLVGSDRTTVFIGSHSHRLQALDLTSGEVFWERVLGDRLESSAAVSKCGALLAVGSYDGQVYFLRVDSGQTWWVFETGDAVKSSPTVDPQTGLFAVGSHDGHVYALEPLTKRCVWKHHCESGAVFSSPFVHSSPRRLYAATLGGQLHSLCPDSGELLWKYSSDVPFFSSPSCSDSCVCIGSVNGDISALSHEGKVLWNFRTAGPVFSSPCLAPVPPTTSRKTGCGAYDSGESPSQAVVCGSHDCFVYGLNTFDGSLLWRFQTTGKVYSSPFVFDGTAWGIRTLVVVASTDGTVWVLDGEQGTLKASLSLPGELFSSPVVWGHKIVVGCRNDYVYCLELTKKQHKNS
ncbi:beta-alanine-activating enzyme [Colossoma macropomum]|uniref:beta-alanine-activating enzyme n=1 Tax=Colossoma macropomum TaxID=42526 RepID=UPI0018643EA3|nr:beta-alanine-activating enzyme [Colossoma macropomum]